MNTHTKKLKISDEENLPDVILDHIELLTCFNCGEKLIDQKSYKTEDTLGTLHLDLGSINYPYEPDEPRGIYFECAQCSTETPHEFKLILNKKIAQEHLWSLEMGRSEGEEYQSTNKTIRLLKEFLGITE